MVESEEMKSRQYDEFAISDCRFSIWGRETETGIVVLICIGVEQKYGEGIYGKKWAVKNSDRYA